MEVVEVMEVMEMMEMMEVLTGLTWLLSRGAQVSVLLLPAAGLLSSQARSHVLASTGHCDNTDVAPSSPPTPHHSSHHNKCK